MGWRPEPVDGIYTPRGPYFVPITLTSSSSFSLCPLQPPTFQVYIVQVSFDRETWLVYRRYSAFEALHVAIRNAVDVMTRTYLTKNFPEKEMGSFFGTFGFVVEKR